MAFAAALCTTVFASCQKINESDLAASAGDIITKTLPVSRELWTSEATKSTYEEGVGLYLTGDEHISVFYSPYVEGAEGIVNLQQNDVEAFPAGDGKYTFSHDAIEGAESYNYYFLMPYTQRASANSDRTGMSARLSPVQCPGENDIDPSNDWLIGRMQTDVAKADELQVTEFKRLFAPFKLVVADPDNIFGDEKLRTATLTFSQDATNKYNSIVGVFYADFSDNYEDAGVLSFLSTAPGNSVTAVFGEDGCSKTAEGYPVWFMLNPIDIQEGDATLTVSSDTRTITRSVSLSSPVTIEEGKFNRLTFNMSGSGMLPEEESVTQSFSSVSSLSDILMASDGNSYQWGFNNCLSVSDAGARGLRLNNSTLELPTFAGKKLSGIRFIAHRASANGTYTITVSAGEDVVATADFNYYTLTKTGGVCEVEIPEEYSDAALSVTASSNWIAFSAITFLFDATETDPDAPRLGSAQPADSEYGHLYLGREVVVSGENLASVTAFTVDGVEAPVSGTPTANEARFVMPETISGTSAKVVTLGAVTPEGDFTLGTVTVYPFYCTKGLRLGVGSNSAANYTDDGRNMSFLLLDEGRVISAQEWVESRIDPFAMSGNNTVTTAACLVTGTEEEYYSVQPYMFLTSSGTVEAGDAKLAFQNPSGSTSQLRNHRYPRNTSVIGDNKTLGTPVVKFRIIDDDDAVKSAVSDGSLDDILAHDNMCGANAPAFGTVEGDTWVEGSVIAVQYENYGHASATADRPEDISDVKNQGYIYIRDITCADLATGYPIYPTTGYVEFDLYWSNPLN